LRKIYCENFDWLERLFEAKESGRLVIKSGASFNSSLQKSNKDISQNPNNLDDLFVEFSKLEIQHLKCEAAATDSANRSVFYIVMIGIIGSSLLEFLLSS